MAQRFIVFCLAVLVGVVLLHLAVQLLSQFWGWLALLAGICTAVYVAILIVRARRDRW